MKLIENKNLNEFMVPINDYIFKRIFGYVGNEHITKDLLESILKIKLNSISLDENTILEKDLASDKIGILDDVVLSGMGMKKYRGISCYGRKRVKSTESKAVYSQE